MKHLLIAVTFIVGASCQIYTQAGPDGYKYPKPIARLDVPQTVEEPSCVNGGSGPFCCQNGVDNADCCENGGRGQHCCENGADNKDCCENNGSGAFCCTNGANNPNCQIPTAAPTRPPPPPPAPFVPKALPVKPLPVKPQPQPFIPEPQPFIPEPEEPEPIRFELPITLPPLPSFIPKIDFPAFIPVVNKPAPFAQPAPLPVKPQVLPVQVRVQSTENNGYLPPVENELTFTDWKKKYNKRYASKIEEKYREIAYNENVVDIRSVNADFRSGKSTVELAPNFFADLKTPEFLSIHTGLKRVEAGSSPLHHLNLTNTFMSSASLNKDVPESFDWRDKGAVTPVKNQGSCASCWAFAANGAIETQHFLKTGKLVSLSEQNLLDCVKENDGCDGGYMTTAYEYVQKNPGVDIESTYPYEEKQLKCRFDPKNIGAKLVNFMEINEGDEEALKQAVATVGPVAVGIDGSLKSFMFYKSGFYFDSKCDTEVNHAVLIVGYGATEAGEEYWICKNSWDTDWGEAGYVRMARNKKNHCGIASLASYPLV